VASREALGAKAIEHELHRVLVPGQKRLSIVPAEEDGPHAMGYGHFGKVFVGSRAPLALPNTLVPRHAAVHSDRQCNVR
jgi:hypothetical protein